MINNQTAVQKLIDGTDLKPIFIDAEGEVVLYGTLNCDHPLSSDNLIKLSEDYSQRGIGVHITDLTKICLYEPKAPYSDIVYILAKVENDRCVAEFICEDIFKATVGYYGDVSEKKNMLEWFAALQPEQQRLLLVQIRGKLFDSFSDPSNVRMTGRNNLLRKYRLTKATYTPQQQADIEELFEATHGSLGSGTKKQKAEDRLQKILNINQSSEQKCTLTKSEIIAALNKELYKLDGVKEEVAEAIVASKYSKEKGLILALVGNPGVGKTAIAKAIAKVLNLPFRMISLGSSSTMLDMTGLCYTYDGSDSGEPVKSFYNSGTTQMVMLLDEFDDAINTKEGNPQNAFTDMLSDDRFFKDAYLGTYIRTPDTIVILTMNSTENVPAHILDRCTVIRIEDYENEDKREIVNRHILPSILAEFQIPEDMVDFPDREIMYLLENYCEDAGVRDAKRFTKKIIRHILSSWDEKGERTHVRIDRKLIDSILEMITDSNSDSKRYIRNKHLYSPEARREIRSLFEKLKRTDIEGPDRIKAATKLHYLISLIPNGNAFTDFDSDRFFADMNKTHFGMEKIKNEIAEIFYCKTLQKKALSSVRILLVGDPGIGKSSIISTIASALHSEVRRIALNGVSDERVIKGHSYTYIDADAGKIIKAAADMRTTRGILHLDEVDKLGRREGKDIAETLVDVLDNSAMLTDNFLGIPIDFSESMFIATANDLSQVPQVILDRFIVIHLDGYTKDEKAHIATKYILPKIQRAYCPEGISLRICKKTLSFLIDRYCPSSGIRDIEKALERVVSYKLYVTRNDKRSVLTLTEKDIIDKLGTESSVNTNSSYRKIGF